MSLRARFGRSNLLNSKMGKQYFLYIMTNKSNNVLSTGVTNDLKRRIYEHKAKLISGFTKKYNVNKLVYYEVFGDAYNAISREKQIKSGSRQKKINLVNNLNPKWSDLYNELCDCHARNGLAMTINERLT